VARGLMALWRLYIVDSYYGSLGHAGSKTWDVRLSRYDGLPAVRVNEPGAAILHDPGALPHTGLPVPHRTSAPRPGPGRPARR
jgi:hypothetical protein